MDEAAVAQRAADALARFLERGVGQPDDREARQPGRDVDLDPDDATLEAVERRGVHGGQHRLTLRSGTYLRLMPAFTATYQQHPAPDDCIMAASGRELIDGGIGAADAVSALSRCLNPSDFDT